MHHSHTAEQATSWRNKAGTPFQCRKTSATAAAGMAVTNQPLASAAAIEILAQGGNAVDAAIGALFTLTVVEPMMVGILGGGTALIRLADGQETVIDGLSTAPSAARPDCYRPVSAHWPDYMEVHGRENAVGPRAMAVPGNLAAWCETHARYGALPLDVILRPAIRHAAQGFQVTHYMAACIADVQDDLRHDAELARLLLPGGNPLRQGATLVQSDYACTLQRIAQHGVRELTHGELGQRLGQWLRDNDAMLTLDDIRDYRPLTREPVRGHYRGFDLIGPPPPCSGGVHVVQMLNLLSHYDVAGMGFGTPDGMHLLLETMKIAAADRARYMGDPAFLDVPVAHLTSQAYATQRLRDIDMAQAGRFTHGVLNSESANTTHVTVTDGQGNIVTSTQTINSLFGARRLIPGTGVLANNYMYVFDPHPGNAMSIQPGKRLTSAQAPLIVMRDGKPYCALGLPGGARIYSTAMQTLLNLIDHGMSLQEAVEAPRIWTQGQDVEIEDDVPAAVVDALVQRGHRVVRSPHIGGGMCAVQFHSDGGMTGSACWRADGAPAGISGGFAREGISFWPEHRAR